MPGLPKQALARRVLSALDGSRVRVIDARFKYESAPLLPWLCRVSLGDYGERRLVIYFWTIGHGGRTRSTNEYRIQTKLEGGDRRLSFDEGTTLLMGYYRSDLDLSGRAVGNVPPPGMEVFAAWDALPRLRLGWSSSCQVSLRTLVQGYETGLGESMRTLAGGTSELVLAFPPRHLDLYLEYASLGHGRLSLLGLRQAIGVREASRT